MTNNKHNYIVSRLNTTTHSITTIFSVKSLCTHNKHLTIGIFPKKIFLFTKVIKISSFILCIYSLLLSSCNESVEVKKYRKLRNDVLAHYENDANSLKKHAAIFLLDNLKYRYTLNGQKYQTYVDFILKNVCKDGEFLHGSIFPLKFMSLESDVMLDVNQLTPEYLIN